VRIRGLVLLLGAACAAQAAPVIKVLHWRIPMRDGVNLAANIFRPAEAGRSPTILVRTPYNKGKDINANYQAFVDRGYAVVVEDVRGRFESEGVFRPLEQEPKDGYDTIDWIARQSWSDGQVGMMGGSYLGIVQWKVAALNSPHLKAIFPQVSGYDDYRDRFYSTGGAMKLGNRLNWMADNLRAPGFVPEFNKFVLHVPLRTADRAATGQTSEMFQEALNHPTFDAFWKSISTRERLADIRIPVFAVGGWYDNFVESDLDAFAILRRISGRSRIMIGPWPHNMATKFPNVSYGPEADVTVRALQLEWFDHWLKGKDVPLVTRPPARLFVMGINRWREEREWPPESARPTAFYIESRRGANSLGGDGTLGAKPTRRERDDHFVYDPQNPVPTRGGAVCCNPRVFPWGPMDQRPVELRRDVLVYTSRPLRKNLQVIGPVKVILYASTTARDTDFTAKLVDVFPDGEARNLTDGILRLRYRNGLEKAAPATPGEVHKLTLEAGVTSNVFLKGHRIRLEISSSNFPRFDRNANTGGPIADEARLVPATQTIHHDQQRPSHLLLSVVP
jgi:putative CocE/NonD family hydrolase